MLQLEKLRQHNEEQMRRSRAVAENLEGESISTTSAIPVSIAVTNVPTNGLEPVANLVAGDATREGGEEGGEGGLSSENLPAPATGAIGAPMAISKPLVNPIVIGGPAGATPSLTMKNDLDKNPAVPMLKIGSPQIKQSSIDLNSMSTQEREIFVEERQKRIARKRKEEADEVMASACCFPH